MNYLNILSTIVIALIAVVHVYILVLEMFLWDKPIGLKTFGHTKATATASKVLAANQGLYNGFLAAGLFWGLYLGDTVGADIKIFFLCCILVAGLFGGFTAKRKILLIQATPALIALVLIFLQFQQPI